MWPVTVPLQILIRHARNGVDGVRVTMSMRRNSCETPGVDRLRSELEELKNCARVADAEGATDARSHAFDQLSTVEQSAASLGVNPTAWKPISFLNNGHYSQLVKANMLDDTLARRIEAYRCVAAADAVA